MLASSAIDRAPARVWAFSTIQLSARLALGIVLALFAGECVINDSARRSCCEFIRAGRCWPSTKAVPRITTAGRKADATIESASTQLTQSRGTIPAWRSLLKCTCVREHQRWCSTDAADTCATQDAHCLVASAGGAPVPVSTRYCYPRQQATLPPPRFTTIRWRPCACRGGRSHARCRWEFNWDGMCAWNFGPPPDYSFRELQSCLRVVFFHCNAGGAD